MMVFIKQLFIFFLCCAAIAALSVFYLGMTSCSSLSEWQEKRHAQLQEESIQRNIDQIEDPVIRNMIARFYENLEKKQHIPQQRIGKVELSHGQQQIVFFDVGYLPKLIFADTQGTIVDSKEVRIPSDSSQEWNDGKLLVHDINNDGKQDIILYGNRKYTNLRSLKNTLSTMIWVYFQTENGFGTVYAVNDKLCHPHNSGNYIYSPTVIPDERFYATLSQLIKPDEGSSNYRCKKMGISFDIPNQMKNSITVIEEENVVWITHNNRGLTEKPILLFGVELVSPENIDAPDGAPLEGPFLGKSYRRHSLGTLGKSVLILRESFTNYSTTWKEDADGTRYSVTPFTSGTEQQQMELIKEHWQLTQNEVIRKTLMVH